MKSARHTKTVGVRQADKVLTRLDYDILMMPYLFF